MGVRKEKHTWKLASDAFLRRRKGPDPEGIGKLRMKPTRLDLHFLKLVPQENTDCQGLSSGPHLVAMRPEGRGRQREGGDSAQVIRQEST